MPLVRKPDSAGKTLLLMEYGKERHHGPSDCPDQQLEDVHKIEIRDDDVLLCSYPKSGCHWLWEIARMLRAETTDVPLVEKDRYMMELMPQEKLLELPSPRILNTHFLFHQLPKKVQDGHVKMLFIYRNPKDVSVSFYNHHIKLPEYEYQGQFGDYLTGLFLTGQVDFGDFFTYTRNWESVMNSRPDLKIFVISYEELHADTFKKAKELAQFLGSSADDDTIRDIVVKCSFTKMLDRKGRMWAQTFGDPIMYRKGKVGDWKTWFSEEHSKIMDAACEKGMKDSKFKFQYTL